MSYTAILGNRSTGDPIQLPFNNFIMSWILITTEHVCCITINQSLSDVSCFPPIIGLWMWTGARGGKILLGTVDKLKAK